MSEKYRKFKKKCLLAMLGTVLLGSQMPFAAVTSLAADTGAAQTQTVTCPSGLTAESITYKIVLDPGHGGDDTGADGWNSSEKRLNLKIGLYLKEELEKYNNVQVEMTRNKDVFVGLHKRIRIAAANKADLMVSLHNDSWDSATPYDNGCSVLVAKKGSYRPEMITQEVYLARSILSELKGIGLVNRGMMRKKSDRVPEYEDGSKGDYHAIIRDGMRMGIPSILIEHAFCDSKHDYKRFLKTDGQLKKLAQADARGIARFLQLKRKDTGEVLPSIEVKGKIQQCSADPGAYYTLAQKRYYNVLYDGIMAQGGIRHKTNLNIAGTGTGTANSEAAESAEALELEKAAQIKAEEIARRNEQAQKDLPYVIWGILAGFGLLVLIREMDFGFSFSIRIKRRGEKYEAWKNWKTQYNYDKMNT